MNPWEGLDEKWDWTNGGVPYYKNVQNESIRVNFVYAWKNYPIYKKLTLSSVRGGRGKG